MSKYVTNETPVSYQEWLKAINDSLDKQVEESDYHNEVIQEIFSFIKTDQISPAEYSQMKDDTDLLSKIITDLLSKIIFDGLLRQAHQPLRNRLSP